jgi:hypothetical protein
MVEEGRMVDPFDWLDVKSERLRWARVSCHFLTTPKGSAGGAEI